jgi:hypothetical protein
MHRLSSKPVDSAVYCPYMELIFISTVNHDKRFIHVLNSKLETYSQVSVSELTTLKTKGSLFQAKEGVTLDFENELLAKGIVNY